MHALEADGRVRRRHSVVMVLGKNSAPAPAPTPAQLTEIVRERVQDGTIKPGEPITVRLLEEFGVGKTQLRRALAPLIAEELLVTRNGIGSYVPHPPTSDTAPTHQDKAGTPRRTTDGHGRSPGGPTSEPEGLAQRAVRTRATGSSPPDSSTPTPREALQARAPAVRTDALGRIPRSQHPGPLPSGWRKGQPGGGRRRPDVPSRSPCSSTTPSTPISSGS
ncbi:GntR family transcriptional regulator [Streptomyces griseus]|nr:GntR family transcriptional regulator [Streptomyces griseus]